MTDRFENELKSVTKSYWQYLTHVKKNTSYYVIKKNQIFKNKFYQFQVLGIAENSWGKPSKVVNASTRGLAFFILFYKLY